jgi:hypothetical protein
MTSRSGDLIGTKAFFNWELDDIPLLPSRLIADTVVFVWAGSTNCGPGSVPLVTSGAEDATPARRRTWAMREDGFLALLPS